MFLRRAKSDPISFRTLLEVVSTDAYVVRQSRRSKSALAVETHSLHLDRSYTSQHRRKIHDGHGLCLTNLQCSIVSDMRSPRLHNCNPHNAVERELYPTMRGIPRETSLISTRRLRQGLRDSGQYILGADTVDLTPSDTLRWQHLLVHLAQLLRLPCRAPDFSNQYGRLASRLLHHERRAARQKATRHDPAVWYVSIKAHTSGML